jgi:small-conductance mechanosensitive channel
MVRLLVLLVFLISVVPMGGISAQEASATMSFEEQSAEWDRTLAAIEQYAQGSEQSPALNQQYTAQLKEIQKEAAEAGVAAKQEMLTRAPLLESLGPPPKDEDPPEPQEIKAKREELNANINVFRTRLAQVQLTRARIKDLEDALSAGARQKFRETLLMRGPLPLAPDTVTKAVPEFGQVLRALARSWSEWRSGLSPDQLAEVRWRGVMVLVALIVAWVIRRFLLKRYGRDVTIEEPSYSRRFLAAVVEGVARGIVPSSLFAVPLILIPLGLAVSTGRFAVVVGAVCFAMIIFILGEALTRAVLAPDLPAWRLTQMTAKASRVLSRRIIFLLAVFAIDMFFDRVAIGLFYDRATENFSVSQELASFYAFTIDFLEAVGIILVVQGWLWCTEPETPAGDPAAPKPDGQAKSISGEREENIPVEHPGGRAWTLFRRAIGAAAVCGVVANLIGYVRLGDKLIDGLLFTGVILAALFLIRKLLRELIGIGVGSHVASRWLGLRENSRGLLGFWLCAVLDFFLLSIAVYAILPVWGVPRTDLTRWIGEILQGFTVGGVTISLADIVKALMVFVVAIAVTRLIRQTLSEKVLAKTSLDTGIRNSLSSGITYIGITIAALLAVGVMGFNFQNIAIIAGALSVGIGFGLQNIVNNFVSGLILLVERPIKIGDWVVVGENQGYVKRISVRATEIQTFDRASVILPNSELLSTAVMNWTHKDKLGRVIIPVGVAYGSDTEKVRELLFGCAAAHPEVVTWPAPYVIFQNFGASSLDFELRAYLRDVGNRLTVGSDLRFAIDKAFRDAGIEIPFSQHDIHLRDIDRLERTLGGVGHNEKPGAKPPSADRDDTKGGPAEGGAS